jgi:hypothetical protein
MSASLIWCCQAVFNAAFFAKVTLVAFLYDVFNWFTGFFTFLCGWVVYVINLIFQCLYVNLGPLITQISNCVPPIGALGGKFITKTGTWIKVIKIPLCGWCTQIIGDSLIVCGKAWSAFLGKKQNGNYNVTGLLRWVFIYVLFFLFWIILGEPGLSIPLYLNQTSDLINEGVEAFVNLLNGIMTGVGLLFSVLNILRPFLNILIWFFMELFFLTIADAIDPPFRNNPREARELFYTPADSVYDAYTVSVLAQIHSWLSVLSFITALLITLFKVLKRFGFYILILLKVFVNIGLFAGTCCASAPGCCARTFFRDIILAIGLDIGQCTSKEIANMQCSCSRAEGGPLAADVSCEGPSYVCKLSGGQYEEYRLFRNNPSQPFEQVLLSTGPVREVVCKNTIRTGESQSQERRILEECSCLFEGGLSFSFCGNFLNGDCDENKRPRRLEGELWRQHLKKLKKNHPDTYVRETPRVEFSPKKESPLMKREQFIEYIKQTEQEKTSSRILWECDEKGDEGGFENFVWRLHCLSLKKINDKISFVSLPHEHITHIHRYLSEEDHTLPRLLDNLARTHNREYPSPDPFSETHEEDMLRMQKVGEHLTRRSTEAIETLKRLNARSLFDPPDPATYKCPGSDVRVPRSNLKLCPPPTEEALQEGGTFFELLFYQINLFGQTFDFQLIIRDTVQCMRTISENPEINPGTQKGIEREFKGESENLLYCFPMFSPLQTPGKFQFSWSEFVKQKCSPQPQMKGTVFPCRGVLYDDSDDVFNWTEMWLSFIPQAPLTRLYNSWCALQWLITRLFFIEWVNNVWGTIFGLFGASLPLQNAFSPTWASQGLSDGTNWFLFSIHGFSLLWFIFFVLLPTFLFWRYFSLPLWIILSALGRTFILRPIIGFLKIFSITKKEKRDIEKQATGLQNIVKLAISPEND